MSDHYYTAKPTVKSNRQKWQTILNEQEMNFYSDRGVFSKDQVDVGSRVMIETVDPSVYPSGAWLDMGCGYGPIGLALAKSYPEIHVEMVDINERAVELSRENALLNGIKNVDIHSSNLFEDVKGQEFAAIFCNPPIRAGKQVVHQILEESKDYLKKGGFLTIVIQRKQGAPSAQAKMEAVFGNVERIGLEKGYWILTSKK